MSAIVIAPAIANVEPAGPVSSLVHRVEIAQGEKQVNLPFWGRMTAKALSEGVDLNTPSQMSVTVRNLTATEHGLLSFVSNRLKRQNNENILATVGKMQGNAIGRLLDSDLITLFASVSNSIGAAGADNDLSDITGAVSYLATDNNTAFGPAIGKANIVLHSEQLRRLLEAVVPLSSGVVGSTVPAGLSEDLIRNYWRGNDPLFGSPIYMDGNIDVSSTDATGCAFVELAFSLAIANEVEANDDDDISLRGTEIVTTMEWGELENVDEWATAIVGAADPKS